MKISTLVNYVPAAILLVVAIVLWEAIVLLFHIPAFLMPTPIQVWAAIINPRIDWQTNILATVTQSVGGFALAAVTGITLAMLTVQSRRLNRLLYPYILISQVIPKVAVAPLVILWLGFSPFPKILLAFFVAFFPIVIDTTTGLNALDPAMIDLLKTFHARGTFIMLKARFPNALPQIFAGFKVAITLAVIGSVVGEFVAPNVGLGALLITSQTQLNTILVFASLVMLTVVGISLYAVVEVAEHYAIPWYSRRRKGK